MHPGDRDEHAELINRFRYHPADSPERIAAHERVRRLCLELAEELYVLLPASREKSLAMTHLDQVCMFSNAAVARHGPGDLLTGTPPLP